MLLWSFLDFWKTFKRYVIFPTPRNMQRYHCQCVKLCIVFFLLLLEEKLMNLKLLCLLFDPSLTVQQTNTCRGSSAVLKFQSSSYFQSRSVSFPYFRVLMLTLVGETCR